MGVHVTMLKMGGQVTFVICSMGVHLTLVIFNMGVHVTIRTIVMTNFTVELVECFVLGSIGIVGLDNLLGIYPQIWERGILQ